ncbi:YdcF family protein [Nocardiopsis flavescens]|uniref:YdcF family protein n=1 Tax=Nocardiopsis flavescens TaxID=758803 RepID=UPI0036461E34
MRTANDGRGDETWEDPAPASSTAPDDDATRVISRSDLPAFPAEHAGPAGGTADPAGATGGADETAVFSRDALTAPFAAQGPDSAPRTTPLTADGEDEASATRAFARGGAAPAPEGAAEAAFTRRFVRERPGGRGPDTAGADTARPDTPPRSRSAPPPQDPPRRRRTRPAPRPRGRRLRLRWIVTALLLTALALPPATWGWVWYTARQDDRAATDAIVVLGASQYNGVPSPVFEARLRHAQVLYLDGVAPVIVTVGGKQPGDNFTEAAAGRNWLIEVGIPSDRIIAVEEGSDTLQSVRAVSTVFADNAWDEATLVSDPWHSLRSKVMASDHGIDSGTSPSRSGPAVIERRTQLWYITRETASLWYYWIFNDSSDIRVNAA